MAAVTSASFCLLVFFLVCSSEADENITAELGGNVTLRCKVADNNTITFVEWSKPGLDPDCVFLYRDGHFNPVEQNPSYKNRVNLEVRGMKDGNVSLILMNVKMEDKGRYECCVLQGGTNRRKRSSFETKIINLEVLPPGYKDGGDKDGGDKDGNSRGHLGGVVGVILLAVALVGFLINKRLKKKNPKLPVPPDEAAAEQML